MVVQRRNIVTESEKNRILGLYGRPQLNESIVIAEWLSPDEKYCIFLDDLIDIENKTKIGNIWENFDHFKFFLRHSFEVATTIPQEIKESVLTSLNSFLITESNQNMEGLKPYVKELLSEGVFGDAWDWMKEKGSEAVQGVKDFTNKSIEGVKKAYNYIKDADWSKAFDIIKKGVLYVARSIRSALYHPIGILLDAILVASGIGKTAQFIIWGVVVGLDLYELISGNFEDPNLSMPWRLLFLGVDILGLVFAGAAAKGAKNLVGSLIRKFGSSAEGLAKAIQSSKPLQQIVTKILSGVKSAGGVMGKVSSTLQKSSPKLFNFLSRPIGALGKFTQMIVDTLGSLLKGGFKAISTPGKTIKNVLGGQRLGKGAQAALNTTAVLGGVGAYEKGKKREYDNALEQGLSNPNVSSEYNYDEL